jgi:hypothetical protein
MVELLSTLALATKQVKQGRFSGFVLVGIALYLLLRREIYKEDFGREGHRGDPP